MTLLKKNIWIWVKEYTLITIGVLLYVMGWIIFLVPNNMIGGGVTGLGSIVQYATGGLIKIGYTYFVVNTGLVVAALFVLLPSPSTSGRDSSRRRSSTSWPWTTAS